MFFYFRIDVLYKVMIIILFFNLIFYFRVFESKSSCGGRREIDYLKVE